MSVDKPLHMIRLLLVVVASSFLAHTSAAQDTTRIDSNLLLVKLTERAYLHTSYSQVDGYGRVASNGIVFINDTLAFLFDTPMSNAVTDTLISYLEDSLNLTLKGFVPNHWHDDCTGGMVAVRRHGAITYGHEATSREQIRRGLSKVLFQFECPMTLHLGELEMVCHYPGPAHTSDNIVVWLPSEKLLFGGCMVRAAAANSMGNTADADLKAWPKSIKNVRKAFPDAAIVVPGHGPIGGTELLDHTLELLKEHQK